MNRLKRRDFLTGVCILFGGLATGIRPIKPQMGDIVNHPEKCQFLKSRLFINGEYIGDIIGDIEYTSDNIRPKMAVKIPRRQEND